MKYKPGTAEQLLFKGLATIGFLASLIRNFEGVPGWFGLLLIGLFFGPEILRGQLNLNRRDNPNTQEKSS